MVLPVIGAPMFIVSTPAMVIAQCKAGVIGSFPSLNARPAQELENWLQRIHDELATYDASLPKVDPPDNRARSAPFAVNLIVHKSNDRLAHDLDLCVRYRVPMVITSLGAREDVNQAVHAYGGIVLHDVINDMFAHKAVDKGADGLIAVAAGAGGHAGTFSPFALIEEIREWFSGPLVLSGAIATGRGVAAARALGADLAYIGSAFIATREANAPEAYKQMIVDFNAAEIVYSSYFTGVHGNYLKPSIRNVGLDPENLPQADPTKMDFAKADGKVKAWRDVWSAGQGIGAVKAVVSVAELVSRLKAEYEVALEKLTSSQAKVAARNLV